MKGTVLWGFCVFIGVQIVNLTIFLKYITYRIFTVLQWKFYDEMAMIWLVVKKNFIKAFEKEGASWNFESFCLTCHFMFYPNVQCSRLFSPKERFRRIQSIS